MSVVLPVRDGAAHVLAAVADLCRQTLTDVEIVVVDDASVDATAELLASVDDPRVRVVPGPGTGIVNALAAGLAVARGAYVARMDADDRCPPERLAVQARVLDERPEVAVVGCAFAVTDDRSGSTRVEVVPPDDALLRRALWVRNPFAHGSVMMRRVALDAVGAYRDTYPAAEDYDLWCRISAQGRLAAVPTVLYEWRRSATGISAVRADAQRTATDRILADRWAAGLPPHLARRAIAEAYGRVRSVASSALDLGERGDELQLAVVVALARRGHGRRARAQLGAYLCSRPGAWSAAVVYLATGGRGTRGHRVLAGLRRRMR